MKFYNFRLETTALLLLGCGLLLISSPRIHLRLLNPTDHSFLWNRSGVISAICLSYGIAAIVLAAFSFRLSSSGKLLTGWVLWHMGDALALVRQRLVPSICGCLRSRRNAPWVLAALIIGVGVRAYFLTHPMRYDEAYTFLKFVNADLSHVFYYPYPNNHVLHTALVKISTFLWGPHPASIRLPAFVAGIASIPLMFYLCRTLVPGPSGVLAAMAMAVLPYLVLYSTNARGYSMVVLLTLALSLVAARIAKSPSVGASGLLSLVAALGLLTIPSMAFAVASVYLWLTCLLLINGLDRKRIALDFVIPSAVMTLVFTGVLYTPVILVSNGVEPVIANHFVEPQSAGAFFYQADDHFVQTFADHSRDLPRPIVLFTLVLAATGFWVAFQRRNWPLLLILPSVVAASAALFIWKQRIPYPRTWIYLIPFVLLMADAGLAFCLHKLSKSVRMLVKQGVIMAGAFYAIYLISTDAIAKYPDTGNFPEAPLVARHLKPIMDEGDKVYAGIPADYPTYFYLWYNDLDGFRGTERAAAKRKFFVVQKSQYSIEDTTQEEVVKIIEVGDAAIYQSLSGETSDDCIRELQQESSVEAHPLAPSGNDDASPGEAVAAAATVSHGSFAATDHRE